MYKKITLALLACSFLFTSKAFARCADIVGFPSFSELTEVQQSLMNNYLPHAKTSFESWSLAHNGLATEFIANTQALERLYLKMPDGSMIQGIYLIDHINRVEGDRLKVKINSEIFNVWREAGAKYEIYRANGKIERGHFRFNHGDLGGSLHHGYDIQGYSSAMKVPRVQINYRFNDDEGDMDLDGFQPWLGGIIPNFHHLSWNNSDVRCWISEYESKFGALFLNAR